MSPRRRKKMPTKVQRLERRLAAVEWALTKAYESVGQLQGEILRLCSVECPRCFSLATPANPPPHRDVDAPALELCEREGPHIDREWEGRFHLDEEATDAALRARFVLPEGAGGSR